METHCTRGNALQDSETRENSIPALDADMSQDTSMSAADADGLLGARVLPMMLPARSRERATRPAC